MTVQEMATEQKSEQPWLKIYDEIGVHPEPPNILERSLADYVEEHAVVRPDASAFEYLGITVSWRELDQHGNRFANLLKSLGMSKGDVLGIHLPNTPQYVIALVGAAKLGVIVSGIAPLLTAPEITHQVNDAKIKVLITLDQFYKVVRPIGGSTPTLQHVLVTGPIDYLPLWKQVLAYALKKLPKVELESMEATKTHRYMPMMQRASSARVYTQLLFDDTIYIQYTGGTTGKPKGAELTLRSMFINAQQGGAFSPYTVGGETIASAFPLFHMAGLSVSLLAMQTAARFLLIPDPRNLEHFCKEMQKFPPTILANVPTLYMMLTDTRAFRKIDFSLLRMALSGAAPFPVEAIHKLENIIGKGKLCEVYGMTEASPLLTINPPSRTKVGSVGIPVVGTDIRIVDVETGTREMPIGEPGEIIAHGPQIMKGYLNLPEASAKTLRAFDGAVYLYTGDVAAMDADGYLTICDRSKDMLIVGGYKVFSVEVEGKLKELPCVELAALIGEPDTKRPGNDIVTLHVQLSTAYKEQDHKTLETQILTFCRDNMAAYKVPKKVFFHEALPLTAVGKIDKKALRK